MDKATTQNTISLCTCAMSLSLTSHLQYNWQWTKSSTAGTTIYWMKPKHPLQTPAIQN